MALLTLILVPPFTDFSNELAILLGVVDGGAGGAEQAGVVAVGGRRAIAAYRSAAVDGKDSGDSDEKLSCSCAGFGASALGWGARCVVPGRAARMEGARWRCRSQPATVGDDEDSRPRMRRSNLTSPTTNFQQHHVPPQT
jgi:hypothetical protein